MRKVCPSSSERFSRSARTVTISETLHPWTLLRLSLALKGSDTQNNRPPLRVSQALSPGGSCPVSWQCCTLGRFCWATVRFRRAWICVARPNVLPVIRRPRAYQPCRGNGVRNLLQYRASVVKQQCVKTTHSSQYNCPIFSQQVLPSVLFLGHHYRLACECVIPTQGVAPEHLRLTTPPSPHRPPTPALSGWSPHAAPPPPRSQL